jgi:hypothetical protein
MRQKVCIFEFCKPFNHPTIQLDSGLTKIPTGFPMKSWKAGSGSPRVRAGVSRRPNATIECNKKVRTYCFEVALPGGLSYDLLESLSGGG